MLVLGGVGWSDAGVVWWCGAVHASVVMTVLGGSVGQSYDGVVQWCGMV